MSKKQSQVIDTNNSPPKYFSSKKKAIIHNENCPHPFLSWQTKLNTLIVLCYIDWRRPDAFKRFIAFLFQVVADKRHRWNVSKTWKLSWLILFVFFFAEKNKAKIVTRVVISTGARYILVADIPLYICVSHAIYLQAYTPFLWMFHHHYLSFGGDLLLSI